MIIDSDTKRKLREMGAQSVFVQLFVEVWGW